MVKRRGTIFLAPWNKTAARRLLLSRDSIMGKPGSSQAVQCLVEQYYEGLYRYAYRLCGSRADAEDLTQEAFCKAQLHLGQLRQPERARAWLFSILRNAYLHRLRADRQRPCVSLEGVGDLPERSAASLLDVEPQRLQEALGELAEGFRTPIILYYFEDFSYRDIAEQMDLPLGTVMSRLARAKAWLRGRLLEPAAAVPVGPAARRGD
jgi:RNA polymerase sigma-70 factor (ECF subfamily)